MKTIKLALHSILNFRMYSSINLLGMTICLACVITIFRYVYGELTVDRFNKKLDRIFVTTLEYSTNPGLVGFSGIENRNRETTFVNLTEHSGVENFSTFIKFENDEIDVDNQKYNATVLVADSNFLKITDYPIVSGIANLSEPKSALITQNFAQKIFGDQSPIGKTFRHSNGEILTINGIIGQTSTATSLSFDVVVSYYLSNFWSRISQTFVLLYPGVDYRTINKQYEDFFEMPRWELHQRYQLFPLSKVYFDKSVSNYFYSQGNYSYVSILMAVGALILLVGIINYINIFTVVVLRRGRELGIKKVFGAGGHNIFFQLLAENILITGLAIVAAFFVTWLANPFITNRLKLDLMPGIRFDMFLIFGILFLMPVMTTLYPFIRYHYSTPINSLRNFDKIRSTGSLRWIFLSFQYIITMIMIVVSLFFVKQLQFMMNSDPGYRTKDIVKVQFLKYQTDYTIRNDEERQNKQNKENQIADEIVQKMNACPLFTHWTYGHSPNEFTEGGFSFKLPEGEFQNIGLESTDENWFRLFDIELKAGRLWDDEIDDFYSYSIIVTESVLKLYGITDFNNALLQPGNRIWYDSRRTEEMKTNPPYRIVGVVKDFNYLHLSQKSDPIAFHYSKGWRYAPLIAAIVPGRTQEAIAFLRNLYEETVGGEFSYSFVEDEVDAMYKEDKKIATIYTIFTLLTIFISVLGLFSMSLFDIQQRRKEIAIRKVNGATFYDVIRLLLKKYFLSLTVSFVIATPVALYAIQRYLEGFANKTPVSWWLFAIAVTLTVGISFLTLIYQIQKAANQNPAEVVKSE